MTTDGLLLPEDKGEAPSPGGGGVPAEEDGENPFLREDSGVDVVAAAATAATAAAVAKGLGTTGATATGSGAPGVAARIKGTGRGTAAGETKPARPGGIGPPGTPLAGSP